MFQNQILQDDFTTLLVNYFKLSKILPENCFANFVQHCTDESHLM